MGRSALRPGARRPRLCGDRRRRAFSARSPERSRIGHRDGTHLAAGDDALRLRQVATGVIAASGTITQLIPPSLVLIVLADQLGRSVGDMYAGAWCPAWC